MFKMKKITSLILFITIGSMSAFAQTEQKEEVSGEELNQFASALQQVQTVNQQAQGVMIKTIEEEGLEVQRYNEIQQAEQDPNQETNATDEELKQYEVATTEIEKIQIQTQQVMQEKIVEVGLTINRYQEIAAIVQNDPELQQKIQEYLQGKG